LLDLARLIYKIQYAIEGKLKEGENSKLWNKILHKIIAEKIINC
ncbi:18029_t:CDS:1, partial [Dentiscutata erythropus]